MMKRIVTLSQSPEGSSLDFQSRRPDGPGCSGRCLNPPKGHRSISTRFRISLARNLLKLVSIPRRVIARFHRHVGLRGLRQPLACLHPPKGHRSISTWALAFRQQPDWSDVSIPRRVIVRFPRNTASVRDLLSLLDSIPRRVIARFPRTRHTTTLVTVDDFPVSIPRRVIARFPPQNLSVGTDDGVTNVSIPRRVIARSSAPT